MAAYRVFLTLDFEMREGLNMALLRKQLDTVCDWWFPWKREGRWDMAARLSGVQRRDGQQFATAIATVVWSSPIGFLDMSVRAREYPVDDEGRYKNDVFTEHVVHLDEMEYEFAFELVYEPTADKLKKRKKRTKKKKKSDTSTRDDTQTLDPDHDEEEQDQQDQQDHED